MNRRAWIKRLGFGSVVVGLTGKAEAKKPKEKPALMNAEVISSMNPAKDGRLNTNEIVAFFYSTSKCEYLVPEMDVSWAMHSDVLCLVRMLKNGGGYHIYKEPPVIIEVPRKLSRRAMDQLKSNWDRLNKGKRTKQKIIVLDDGMKMYNLLDKPTLLGLPVLIDNSMSREVKTDRPAMKLVRIADTNPRGD